MIIHQFCKQFCNDEAPKAGMIEVHWNGESAMIKYKELRQALECLDWAKETVSAHDLPLKVSLTSSLVQNHIVQIKIAA